MRHRDKAEECKQLCMECMDVCEDTLVNYCLVKGGAHVEKDHVMLMLDCIDICRVSAKFMRRQSNFFYLACYACSEICDACAQSCEEISGKEMERCAALCRRCSDACNEMIGELQAA